MATPYGSTALTYGVRRYRPYISDLITAEASRLPELYALRDIKKQREKETGLKEKELTQTADIAALERESGERIAEKRRETDKLLADAIRMSNESIAKKNRQLEQEKMRFTKKQANIENIISGVNLGLSTYGLAKDIFGGGRGSSILGDIVGGVGSLWEKTTSLLGF